MFVKSLYKLEGLHLSMYKNRYVFLCPLHDLSLFHHTNYNFLCRFPICMLLVFLHLENIDLLVLICTLLLIWCLNGRKRARLS